MRTRRAGGGALCALLLCVCALVGCTAPANHNSLGTLEPVTVSSQADAATSIGSAHADVAVAVFDVPGGVTIGRIAPGSQLSVVTTTEGWLQIELENEDSAWVAENTVMLTPGDRSAE